MIELLTDQRDSDRAFRRWVGALIAGSERTSTGWAIEGTGIVFSNYGHGAPGTVSDQVMLRLDSSFGNGIVKIVRPETSRQDKGKLTVIGRDKNGRRVLLREGWLKKNALSDAVKENFASLSGLAPVPVSVSGRNSPRHWYVVADLNADAHKVLDQTVAFTHACSRARAKAGGGRSDEHAQIEPYRFGLDEKGRVKTVTSTGRTKEVEELQGFVWKELKRLVGPSLTKPTKHGYAVDAMISGANLLIEIKTGVSAHDLYEAVGQLTLYPSLIALPDGLKTILLVPDKPALRPQMAAALAAARVEVQFYSVGRIGKAPEITFSPKFVERCTRLPLKSSSLAPSIE
jgi:hypothetical protein